MKIVIADDHAVVRTGFSMLINYQPEYPLERGFRDYIKWYEDVWPTVDSLVGEPEPRRP